MPTPAERYREGYEKGEHQTLGSAAAEVMFAEMLRDDPGGHFKSGYQDAINNRAFNPPSISNRRPTGKVLPRFSENPIGWFLGVIILVELWALWQLIKAPFQLIAALMRSEKPSLSVIVKNAIVAVAVVASVLGIHEIQHESNSPSMHTQSGSRTATQSGQRAVPDVSEGAPTRPVATASSSLKPELGFRYDAENVLDGRLDTAWVEGVPGTGVGEWVQIEFPSLTHVSEVSVFPGYGKSERLFYRNCRPKLIRVQFMDGHFQFGPSNAMDLHFEDSMKWLTYPVAPSIDTNGVRLTIVEVYPGTAFQDTAISEIRIR